MLSFLGSYHYLVASAIIWCLVGYSVYILLRAGIFAVPQIAYFCVGSYVATVLTTDAEVDFYIAVAAGGAAAAVVGAVLGWLLRSVGGIYLAIATIAFGEVIRVVIRNLEVTGGPSGILGISRATQDWHLVVSLAVVVLACGFLAKQRYGVAMDALRQDQLVAQHLGVAVRDIRIQLFTLSGFMAGVAGGFFAHFRGFIIPNDFALTALLSVLALVVVGGMYGFIGPLVGAVVVYAATELFSGLEQYRTLMLGAVLVVIILFAPRGVAGLFSHLVETVKRWLVATRADQSEVPSVGSPPAVSIEAPPALSTRDRNHREPGCADSEAALSVDGVTMRFGGLYALSDVSFDIEPGQFVGLIGPNGSGKSTLINVISGALLPTAGKVSSYGHELPLGRPEKIAAYSVARSFQGIRLFEDFTPLANVALGAYHLPQPSFPGAGYLASWEDEAKTMLDLVRVPRSMWSREVETLPYGVQRRVEIARALMGSPRLLMLDEPTAGMAENETHEIFQLVADVARERQISVLAVEHDVPVMRAFCDRVVVLNFGQLIADGPPDEVLRDQTVVEAYLGQS